MRGSLLVAVWEEVEGLEYDSGQPRDESVRFVPESVGRVAHVAVSNPFPTRIDQSDEVTPWETSERILVVTGHVSNAGVQAGDEQRWRDFLTKGNE